MSPPPSAPTASRSRAALALAGAVLVAGLWSIRRGQDANWDLRNYHFYNPWAWLTGRYGFDVAPAQLQSFHNPLLDVPFYLMVAADWPPRVIAFVLAIPAGVAGWLLGLIAARTFRDLAPPARAVAVACTLALGLTGANGVGLLGSTMNEWPGTALVLAALWVLLRALPREGIAAGTLLVAGLLAGAASGLKLTAATFALAIGVALLSRLPLRTSLRDAAWYGIGAVAGALATLGPWMVVLAEHYGSPLFPYFNGWLRSPLLPPDEVFVKRFGPRTPAQWLLLPWDLLRPPLFYVGEARYRDARFPLLASLAVAAAGALVVAKWPRPRAVRAAGHGAGFSAELRFLAVFAAVAFAVWAVMHAIHRYLLALEPVAGVLIVGLLAWLVPRRAFPAVAIGVTVLVVATTRHPDWGRIPFGPHFVIVEAPAIEPGALVLVNGDAPLAHLLPALPADARHIGIENNLVRHDETRGIEALVAREVAAHRGPIYELAEPAAASEPALSRHGLARREDSCVRLRSNLARAPIRLCRLTRIGTGANPPAPARPPD